MIVVAKDDCWCPNWKIERMLSPIAGKDNIKVWTKHEPGWKIIEGEKYEVGKQYLEKPTKEEKEKGKLYFDLERSTLFKAAGKQVPGAKKVENDG